MPDDSTMILYLNADQATALYDLQVSLLSIQETQENSTNSQQTREIHSKEIASALDLYRRVMCPTYKPEEN